MTEFDASPVADEGNSFDLAAGYWKDDRGVEHHAPINAYQAYPYSGEIIVLEGLMVSLVRGARDARQLREINPRALCFVLVGEGEDREVSLSLRSRSTLNGSGKLISMIHSMTTCA